MRAKHISQPTYHIRDVDAPSHRDNAPPTPLEQLLVLGRMLDKVRTRPTFR
jgi:hypothetical protein